MASKALESYREQRRQDLVEREVIGENDPLPSVKRRDSVSEEAKEIVARHHADTRTREEILRCQAEIVHDALSDPDCCSVDCVNFCAR